MTRTTPPSMPAGRRRTLRAERGFTLVELIVALTAGLLVASSAYALARNAMKSFQDESRITTSQVGTNLGLARLTADLQRAGYMASPNLALDPRRCPTTQPASAPIQALQIRERGSGASGGLDVAKMGYGAAGTNPGLETPDAVVIAGNMTSAEQFEYRGIDGAGRMHLAVDRGPIQRAWADVGQEEDAFTRIFVPLNTAGTEAGERFARIIEASGKEAYVKVTEAIVVVNSGALTSVQLQIEDPTTGAAPQLSGATCGARSGSGLINPVSFIRYRVAQLCNPTDATACDGHPYAAALRATGADAVTGESTRAELVREELTPAAVLAGPFSLAHVVTDPPRTGLVSQEVVAEFAVDLNFEAIRIALPDSTAPGQNPALSLVPFDAADDAISAIPSHRFRGLRVRFGTRARVPDRDAPSPTDAVTRFQLSPLIANNVRNRYARMRTLHADVQLPNLQAVGW